MLSTLPWWLFSILFAVGFAAYLLVNQQWKLRADLLMVWRGVINAAILTPVVFFIHLPGNIEFYLAVIAVGFVACFVDMRMLHASSVIGGGPVSRLMPISVWVSFAIWTAIDPLFRTGLISEPLRAIGVLGCLALCVVAAAMLRKDTVTRSALPLVLPIIIGGALIDNLNKYAMSHAEPDHVLEAAIGYIWLQSTTIAAILLGRMAVDRNWEWRADLFEPRMIKCALVLCLLISSITLVRNFAMATTPNPGYVGAIGLGATVLIILFNRWRGVQDRSNIKAGLAFVASAAILVLLTR